MRLAGAISAVAKSSPNVLDQLFFLSPRTWLGIIECTSQNSFSLFDASTFTQALLGFTLPYIVFSLFFSVLENKKLPRQLILLCFFSPWSWEVTRAALRQVHYLVASILGQQTARLQSYESALDCLQTRVQEHRAYRTRRYDVFLPPCSSNQSRQQAVLLIPGALVPHVAYAEVASQLSDAGILVAVISLEPLRLAHNHLGCDRVSMQRIMTRIEQQQQQASQHGDNTTCFEWNLIGHSMGALAAMRLFLRFQENEDCSNNVISKLVLWGAAAFLPMSTDLSSFSRTATATSCRILRVQATNDILSELTKDSQIEFDSYFPSDNTQIEWIKGGTHAGFGSYRQKDPSLSSLYQEETEGDGCFLSYQEQQNQACALTAQFLLGDRMQKIL